MSNDFVLISGLDVGSGVVIRDGGLSVSGGNVNFTSAASVTLPPMDSVEVSFSSVNKLAIIAPENGASFGISDGKSFSVTNSLTFSGMDASSVNFGVGGDVIFQSNKLSDLTTTSSSELAGVISDETGSGSLVFSNSPTLVTPILGTATASSINKITFTSPATSATITIADGKVLTANNTLTFSGTDSSSINFTSGGTVIYNTSKLSDLALTNSLELAGVITDETGSGSLVFAESPTLVTPILGTATATTINQITFTAPTNGATITIADGKVLTTNNTLTFSGTDASSINFTGGGTVIYNTNKLSDLASTNSLELAGVITDETGTGSLVFSDSPSLFTPVIGNSITSNSTAFELLNSTVVELSIGGSATQISIGSNVAGVTTINHNLHVVGSIVFDSGITEFSSTVINIDDPLIYLAANNTADITDIGIIGAYDNGEHMHTGLIRQAADKEWKLFSGVMEEPGSVTNIIDLTGAIYDNLRIGGLTATTGAFSAGISGTQITSTALPGTAPFVVSSSTTVANLKAAYVETNADLTGVITSTGNTTSIASKTGTGTKLVVDDTPTLITPILGVATATSINKILLGTSGAETATLTLASNSSLTLVGAHALSLTTTDATAVTLPVSGTLVSTDSSIYLGTTSVSVGRSSSQLTVADLNTSGYAGALKSATTTVSVSGATAPTAGQVLTATNDTTASWVDPAGKDTTGTGTTYMLNTSPTISTSLITESTSFALLNTTTTALNIGGAATVINVGSASGNVAFGGSITTSKVNKVTITEPATSATLTIANNKSITTADSFTTAGAFPLTLTTTASTNVTLPTSGTLLADSTSVYLGTSSISLNRASGSLTLDSVNIDGYAGALKSATTTVSVSAANAPTSGQVLTATSDTTATWQTPTTGSNGTVTSVGISVPTFLEVTNSPITTSGTIAISLSGNNATGSGDIVFATSPSLTTPSLGSATATSINKVTITEPATSATLTIANNKSITTADSFTTAGAFPLTLTTTSATNVTLPTTGTLVADGYTGTATAGSTTALSSTSTSMQVFTGTSAQTVQLPSTGGLSVGKRFTILNNSTNSLTVQTSTGGAVTTQTAGTMATYTVASIAAETWVTAISPSLNSGSSLSIPSAKSITTADSFTTAGAFPLTLTTTASTNVTLPTSGTLLTGTTPTITGLIQKKVALNTGAGTINIDLATGNYFNKTIITGATTFTVSGTAPIDSVSSFILDLVNGGAATSITWWVGVKWVSGTAPTFTTSGRDSLGFYTYDNGTTWTGLVLGKDIK